MSVAISDRGSGRGGNSRRVVFDTRHPPGSKDASRTFSGGLALRTRPPATVRDAYRRLNRLRRKRRSVLPVPRLLVFGDVEVDGALGVIGQLDLHHFVPSRIGAFARVRESASGAAEAAVVVEDPVVLEVDAFVRRVGRDDDRGFG